MGSEETTPSLVGASVRSVQLADDYDAEAFRSPSRSNNRIQNHDKENEKDYTTLNELHDEGALINDEHEYDDLLDERGNVKEGVSGSTVIISGVDNDDIAEEKKQEILAVAAGPPVDIDESHKDFVVVDIKKHDRADLAADTSSYTPQFGGGAPSIYELKNHDSEMSLEDLIDSQIASMSAVSSDLQKKIVKKSGRSTSRPRVKSSLSQSVIPDSVIENDALQQVPAGAREGMDSPLIQSRSQSRTPGVEMHSSPQKPHLARGDSYNGVNQYESRTGRLADRYDSFKSLSSSSRDYLRSISRSRSRVSHEVPVSNEELADEGVLISDELEHAPELLDRINAVQEEDEADESSSRRSSDDTSAFATLNTQSVPKHYSEEHVGARVQAKDRGYKDQSTKEKTLIGDGSLTAAPAADVEDEEEAIDEMVDITVKHIELLEESREIEGTNEAENSKSQEVGDDAKIIKEVGDIEPTKKEANAEASSFSTETIEPTESKADTADEELPQVEDSTQNSGNPLQSEEAPELDQSTKEEAVESPEIAQIDDSINDSGSVEAFKPDASASPVGGVESSDKPEADYTKNMEDDVELGALPEPVMDTIPEQETSMGVSSDEVVDAKNTVTAISGLSIADETERLIDELESEIGSEKAKDDVEATLPTGDGSSEETKADPAGPIVEPFDDGDEPTVDSTEPTSKFSDQAEQPAVDATIKAIAEGSAAKSSEVTKASTDGDFDDLHEPSKDEIVELLKDEPVYIYTSLAGGGYHMPQRTNKLATILTANRIPFTYRDLGTDDEARGVWRRYSKGRLLPGVVRGKDDIIGNWEEIEEANEDYRVRELIYETL